MFHSTTTLPGFSLCTHCHVVRASNQFTYFKFIFQIHYLLYLFCIVNVHRGLAPDHRITMPLQPESPSLCVKTDAFHIFFFWIYIIYPKIPASIHPTSFGLALNCILSDRPSPSFWHSDCPFVSSFLCLICVPCNAIKRAYVRHYDCILTNKRRSNRCFFVCVVCGYLIVLIEHVIKKLNVEVAMSS